MSFWGDIEHMVKKAAQLDPTVLTVEVFEREFRKKHKRKPNANERAQWQAVKAKHGVAGVGADDDAVRQAQDGLTALNPLAPGAAHEAQQGLTAASSQGGGATGGHLLFGAVVGYLLGGRHAARNAAIGAGIAYWLGGK